MSTWVKSKFSFSDLVIFNNTVYEITTIYEGGRYDLLRIYPKACERIERVDENNLTKWDGKISPPQTKQ